MTKTRDKWSIYTDFTGVALTYDGRYDTKEEALERLVELCEIRRNEIVQKLGRARFALTMHRKAKK